MNDCIFCSIVAGTAPAEMVAANDRALALMDINPATDGHTLVVSKSHADDIWDLDKEDGAAVWGLVSEVAMAIRVGLRPDGLTLFQANGSAGWQDVFHFHLHLVPRWNDDGLVRPWTASDAGRDRIPDSLSKIRSALR